MINEARDEAAGLLDIERGAWANAVGFERLVPAFDFAVGLGIVRRSFDVGETGHADELFEVLGNELGSIVGNDPWLGFGVLSRARWMMISTSASVMDSRNSWWTMKREHPSSSEQR